MTAEAVAPTDSAPSEPPTTSIGSVGEIGAFVDGAQAPVHTGSGDQNFYVSYQSLELSEAVLERDKEAMGVVDPQSISRLKKRFVVPRHYREAATMLMGPERCVFIAGKTGSGRNATGQMLLVEAGQGNEEFRTLQPEPDDPSDEMVREGDRLLLDLSSLGDSRFDAQLVRVSRLRELVYRRSARLVVILPADHALSTIEEFRSARVEITGPDPQAVFLNHLAAEGVRPSPGCVQNHFSSLRGKTMSELIAIVHDVATSKRRAPHTSDDQLVLQALNSQMAHREAIEGYLKRPKDVPGRALLLTIGMLEGAPVEVVFEARKSLLEVVRFIDDGSTDLDPPGATKDLARFAVKPVAEDGWRLRFEDPARGKAVVSYFWDEHPLVRGAIARWVRKLISDERLEPADQRGLAHRFGAQCMRTLQVDLALESSEEWALHHDDSVRQAAYAVLSALLADFRTGSKVSQRLYSWARDEVDSSQLGGMTIALCRNVLAKWSLDQAVVRLNWVARRHRAARIREDALAVLRELADDQLGRVLLVLSAAERFDPEIFNAVASPDRIRGALAREHVDWSLPTALERGWSGLLSCGRPELMYPWFELIAEAPDSTGKLVRRLAAVCGIERRMTGSLLMTAAAWMKAADGLSERERRVVVQLSIEQAVRARRPEIAAKRRRERDEAS
ncbi:hypothetical protein OG394_39985 [Kribbella sp. NBC_01245]|uniref:hypothetical protein n=1 Tax=Kribbella sp. NBC_01245 TaxID=2903578 RepID=UPI002E28B7C7|nr:hypothetical protein [Kribbella sp. NBC_01245]